MIFSYMNAKIISYLNKYVIHNRNNWNCFCLLSVILGAFGSHYLKNKMTQTEIQSFEIGVKYLIYHGLSLLIISNYISILQYGYLY